MTDDGDISRRYRELAREEPPRHLDDAIRAAARRAVHTRPAPLVVPTGRQRWYFPLAAAAVIVLAVAVTLHVEREQPGEEIVSAPATPATSPPPEPRAEAQAEKPQSAPQPERRRKTESAESRESRDAAPPPQLQKAPEPVPALPPAPPPLATQDAISSAQQSANVEAAPPPVAGAAARPAPAPKASVQLRRFDDGARGAPSLSASALQSPEQWLQGIADLRKQGRHDEADRSLAEFRKRHPGYQIPEAMLEKVEKR
jgi:outer membrane biosynthesis protein TonB